jgi:hypothetical protein
VGGGGRVGGWWEGRDYIPTIRNQKMVNQRQFIFALFAVLVPVVPAGVPLGC